MQILDQSIYLIHLNNVWIVLVNAVFTHPRLKELLQHLQLILGPWAGVFWSDFELQGLVALWVEGHAALEHVRLEHDHPRLVRVHDGQLN